MSDIPPVTLRIGQGQPSGGSRRNGSSGRSAPGFPQAAEVSENLRADGPPPPPCGACKFLRRRCVSDCIFAPHFGSDQGSAHFAAVHKVFGASNVSKLLHRLPEECRNEAVYTIYYEAQARASSPVYGCVGHIFALQHQVASLQTELAMVQGQLLSERLAVANAINNAHAIQETQLAAPNPAYSNGSSSRSSNMMNISNGNFGLGLGVDAGTSTAPAYAAFDPANLPHQDAAADEEEEEESHHFTNQLFDHQVDRKPFI